jgi:hypothetical protein
VTAGAAAVVGDPLATLPPLPWHPEPLRAAAAAQRAGAAELRGAAQRQAGAVAGAVGSAWIGVAAASCGELGTRLAAAHDAAARHGEAAARALDACAAAWEQARDHYQQARRNADEAMREEQAQRSAAGSAGLVAAAQDRSVSPLRARAVALAERAIEEFRLAARGAAAELDAHARTLAPVPPPPAHHHGQPWYQGALGWLGDRGQDLAGAGGSLLNFGGYAAAHPAQAAGIVADAAGMAVGLLGIAAGAGGEAGGAVLDATGVGLPVGIPVNLASAGLIAAGATVTGVSAVKAGHDLTTMWSEAQSGSSGGGSEPPPPSAGRPVDEVLSGLRVGRNAPNLEVDTAEQLHATFDELSAGGTAVESAYPGKLVGLADGTRIGLRGTSRSGGETIDVFKPDGTYLKVHLP